MLYEVITGATSRGVMLLFLLQGSIIGVTGTFLGSVVGLATVWAMDT